MITFICPNCKFSFSEADKAWDIAIAIGGCPKCNKTHSMFKFEDAFKQAPSANQLGVLGNIFVLLTTAALSAFITFLGGCLGGFLGFALLGHFGLMTFSLGTLVVIFPLACFIFYPYVAKYFFRIKSEGI